jgi:hypothetical protein
MEKVWDEAQAAKLKAEGQMVSDWQKRLVAGEGCTFRSKRLKQAEVNRLALRGFIKATDGVAQNQNGEQVMTDKGFVPVARNFIQAQFGTLLPSVVARNPQFEVQAEDWMGADALPPELLDMHDVPEQPKWLPTLAKVAEALLNTSLQKSDLKTAARRAVAQAMIAGSAWLKVSYNDDAKGRLRKERGDIEEQLRAAKAQFDGAVGDDVPEPASLAGLSQSLQALDARIEAADDTKGLVVEMLKLSEVVLPKGIASLHDYERLPWIAYSRRLTVADFRARFGCNPCKTSDGLGQEVLDDTVVRVFEIWCKASQSVYWLEQGASKWCCAPMPAHREGMLFYPFFLIGWHFVESEEEDASSIDPYPIGAIDGWLEEQEQIHVKSVKARKIVNSYRSAVLANSAKIDSKALSRVDLGCDGEIIAVDLMQGGTFEPYPNPAFDPRITDITENIRVLDQLSGVADFARGGVTRTKTLGEAQLMADNATARQLHLTDQFEEALGKLGRYSLELLVQHLERDDVIALVGGAGVIWPTGLPPLEILQMLKVQVVAGSAGKQNRLAELEKIVSIMPLIEKQMMVAQSAKQQGDYPMAQAARNLAGELLYRADERLSLESIWPVSSVTEPVQATQPAAAPMPAPMPAPQALPPELITAMAAQDPQAQPVF